MKTESRFESLTVRQASQFSSHNHIRLANNRTNMPASKASPFKMYVFCFYCCCCDSSMLHCSNNDLAFRIPHVQARPLFVSP